MILKLFQELRKNHSFLLQDIYAELPEDEAAAKELCKDGKISKVTSAWHSVKKGSGESESTLGPPHLFRFQNATAGKVVRARALRWNLKEVTGNGRSLMLVFSSDESGCVLKVVVRFHTVHFPGDTLTYCQSSFLIAPILRLSF